MVLGQGLESGQKFLLGQGPELGQGPGPGQGPESQPQLQHRSAQQTGAWFRLYFPVQLRIQSCFRPERTHPWALALPQHSWRRPLAILLLDRLSSRLWIGFFA